MVTFSPVGGTTPNTHVAGLLHSPPNAVEVEVEGVVEVPVSGEVPK